MAAAEDYSLGSIAAINTTNQLTGPKTITKHRAEQLLELWTKQGYFTEIDEVIHFGPRCIVEFGGYLLKNFPDTIFECLLCKVAVLKVIVVLNIKCSIYSNCLCSSLRAPIAVNTSIQTASKTISRKPPNVPSARRIGRSASPSNQTNTIFVYNIYLMCIFVLILEIIKQEKI